jgi:Zn ribbon nucleic-acid-binding protein
LSEKEQKTKCEECGSTNVKINYRSKEDIEEGLIESVDCLDCGHHEPYFHITERGKEVLKVLLPDIES